MVADRSQNNRGPPEDRPTHGQRRLPDVLPVDYPPITVRQLLQHTSGIPNYRPEVMNDAESALRDRWRHRRPEELVAVATAHPRLAEPGTAMSYANTNYVLLGMAGAVCPCCGSSGELPKLVRRRGRSTVWSVALLCDDSCQRRPPPETLGFPGFPQ
jgi:hypothetical protein